MAKPGTPVTIRGTRYPSMSSAARHLGVTVGAVWQAKRDGTLDCVGLQPLKATSIIVHLANADPASFDQLKREAQKWLAYHDRKGRK